MNTITATFFFTCYFFAAARADVTCGSGAWAGTSCVELDQCPYFRKTLNRLHQTDHIQHGLFIDNYIRPATCGIYKVCCLIKPPQPENTKPTVKPISCGNVVWKKSLGQDGMPAELEDFPWLALLEYDITGCGRKFGCGGVLISDRHVLTSAQCLDPYGGKLVSVRLGEHDLRTAQDCLEDPDSQNCTAKPIDVGIERQTPHESYSFLRGPSDFDRDSYDIAVLKLNRSVITDVIRPICLPDPIESPNRRTNGTFFLAGWGFTGKAVYPQSLVKLKSRSKRVGMTECTSFYSSIALKRDHICALSTLRKDACIADSGGPLMGVNNQLKMAVMGIYSPVNGQPCQKRDVPSTFVDVKKYVNWIRLQMQD